MSTDPDDAAASATDGRPPAVLLHAIRRCGDAPPSAGPAIPHLVGHPRRYHRLAPLVPLADSITPTLRDHNAATPRNPAGVPPGEAHDAWPRPTPEPDSGFRGAPTARRARTPTASPPNPPLRQPPGRARTPRPVQPPPRRPRRRRATPVARRTSVAARRLRDL